MAEVYSGRKLRLISKHFIFIYSNCIAQFGEYLYICSNFFFRLIILIEGAFMTMCLHYYVLLYFGIGWICRQLG